MALPEEYRLKSTIKYPTSLIIGGLSRLGLEIAESLIEQGGYVIIVDTYTDKSLKKLTNFPPNTLISFIDYSSISDLEEELRRLDYVFFFAHENSDYKGRVSTQEFLKFSNYLDTTLSLASKFESKFLLTTSIKAHQIIISSDEFGFSDDPGIRHKVYKEIELQKYAESLVMEYVEKVQLDARITRLAEMIGEGVDFSVKTPFNELILEAAAGDVLHLKKDGLESEWYVHLLDAAYGIIKAQFTKATLGGIYSICYENPYTHLSVAYKIQEVENGTKEIKFVEETDNLPPIKLYKPAPNLSSVGWMPRISFDKSVKQSIAAAKIHIIEIQTQDSGVKSSKLQNFLDLANKGKFKDDSSQNAITKLLEERRHSEELKKDRLALADNALKRKRKLRPRTTKEKLRTWAWDFVISIGNTFSFFKYKSPAEFGLLLLTFFLIIVLYFVLIAPLLALTKNFLVIAPEYKKLSQEVEGGDYSNLFERSEKIHSSLNESQEILNSFNGVANLLALDEPLEELESSINAYALLTEGTQNIGYSLDPFYEYLENFQNNTQVRTNDENLLSVTDSGINLGEYLEKLDERSPYLNLGIEKVNQADNRIKLFEQNDLPGFLAKEILKVNSKIEDLAANVNELEGNNYLSEVLGHGKQKTYLILLLDNTRLTPIGGEMSAFALVTLTQGSISDVVVKPIDDVGYSFTSVDEFILDEINNTRFTYKNSSNLEINDLASIRNYSEFSSTIGKVFEDTFNTQIDGVLSLNLKVVEGILDVIPDEETIEINGVKFLGSSNFLTTLNQTQIANPSLEEKHKVAGKLLSMLINKSLNDLPNRFAGTNLVFTNEARNKNLLFETATLEYGDYVKEFDLNASMGSSTNYYAKVGLWLEDPSSVTIDRYAPLDYALTTKIDANQKLEQTISVNFPKLGITQEISICIPPIIAESSINILSNFPDERVVINSTPKERCIVYKVVNESSVSASWSSPKLSESQNETRFSINKVIGGESTNVDFNLQIPASINLLQKDEFTTLNDGSLFYNAYLGSDKIITLILNDV